MVSRYACVVKTISCWSSAFLACLQLDRILARKWKEYKKTRVENKLLTKWTGGGPSGRWEMTTTYESGDSDITSATVLVALDGLLDNSGRLLVLVLWLLLVGLLPLLDEPQTTLVEHTALGQAHNAA